MTLAVVSEQGHRWRMEDAHHVEENFAGKGWIFGGVYDGHRGSFAAAYAAQNLHLQLAKELKKNLSPGHAFAEAYHAVSNQLEDQESGATAVTFLIQGPELTVAHAGDSRALLVRADDWVQLTRDHRLEDKKERERIEQCGGIVSYPYVMRGSQGLMPTRTLGDASFKPVGIISTPDVFRQRIHPQDRFLIAACDGLFDVMANEEVAAIAGETSDPQELVDRLRREVLEVRMGMDNLTIVAVDLSSMAPAGQESGQKGD
jgi:serine/threonine protein phosphatase PrpC